MDEDVFRLISTEGPDAHVLVAADGCITFATPQAEALFRYDPGTLAGRMVETLLPARLRAEHVQRRDGFFRAPRRLFMAVGRDVRALRRDETEVSVDIALTPLNTPRGPRALASIRDATERRGVEQARRALERRLCQSQRLEAIGELAAGVAHDLRNILAAVVGFSDLALDADADRTVVQGWVGEIRRAGDRGAALTRQILAFTRGETLQPTVVDPVTVIREVEPMLARIVGRRWRSR